jgi:light-harvesting complex 1 beta chain
MSDNKMGPGTYLTDAEAKELHKGFVVSMAFFVFVAVIAHFLVWSWRPWFGAPKGFAAIESVQQADATRAVPGRG